MTLLFKKQPALLVLAILILAISACKDRIEYKEDNMQKLETLLAEINTMSAHKKCETGISIAIIIQ